MRRAPTAIVVSFVAALSLASGALQAQQSGPTRVLFAAHPAFDASRIDALRSELALRGLALEVVEGWAAGDAERSGAARVASGEVRAVLWLDAEPWRALALGAGGEARTALLPRAPDALDPHVLAVLVSSALDEALETDRSALALAQSSALTRVEEPAASPMRTQSSADAALGDPFAPLPSADDATPRRGSAADGEVHPYAIVDASMGAVWHTVETQASNVAHIVQRVGAGFRHHDLRAELIVGVGADQGIDGSTPRGPMGELAAFVGAALRVWILSVDVGGVASVLVHSLIDSSIGPSRDPLVAGRLGGAIGLSLPDDGGAFPLRLRVELGLYLRAEPSRFAPFTHVVAGVAFW